MPEAGGGVHSCGQSLPLGHFLPKGAVDTEGSFRDTVALQSDSTAHLFDWSWEYRHVPSKRTILNTLNRNTLIEILDAFDLDVADRRLKDGLVEALASSRRASLPRILDVLRVPELGQLCEALDVSFSGRTKAAYQNALLGRNITTTATEAVTPSSDTGLWIKERRLHLGLSQAELAKQVSVSAPSVSFWETGRTEPRAEVLMVLRRVLDGAEKEMKQPELGNATSSQEGVLARNVRASVRRRTPDSEQATSTARQGSFRHLFDQLSSDSNAKGRQFERICKWFLKNDPTYRRLLKNVWLWDECPKTRGRDIGIDLVGEDVDGELWAIQAKAYQPEYLVKKKDIDTFVSASPSAVYKTKLLIATAQGAGSNARNTIQMQGVSTCYFGDLDEAQIRWPTDPARLDSNVQSEPKQPRPHQEEAITAVLHGFESGDRGQLLMACGTGKTLTSLWIMETLAPKRTLLLFPSLSLLAQTLREWTSNSIIDFRFLAVCSDETVTKGDSFVSSVSELGYPATTDPDEIARFCKRRGPTVVFSTYQSSPRISKAQNKSRVPAFDIVIADEAHRCAGLGSGPFATVLDADAIRANRRLYMTATPRYFTGRVVRKAKDADVEMASMDDEEKFGPVFHKLNFSEAIERDLLSDYQVVIVGVDDSTIKKYLDRGAFVSTESGRETDARTLGSHVALAKAMRRFDLRRVITFHNRVSSAKSFSSDYPAVVQWMPGGSRPSGHLWTEHVSGKMATGDRTRVLAGFRGLGSDQRGLLSNARCLSEGVDVPALDGVAFVDPRRSQIDIIQAVGRAIRKAPDKKRGTIIVPVFIEHGDDPEESMESSAFKPIWDVLKALRAHDDVLSEELDSLRRETGLLRHSTASLPDKITLVMPTRLGRSFVHALELCVVEQTTASWEQWYGLLLAFTERRGSADAPVGHVEAGMKLGSWCHVQRQLCRTGRLEKDRQNRLVQLNGWEWNPVASKWIAGFEHLKEFVQRHGHSRVPQTFVVESGHELGSWVSNQKAMYRRDSLSRKRCRLLEALPGWVWDANVAAWTDGYERLLRYVEDSGTSRVPGTLCTADGFKLGAWVAERRQEYRSRRLSSEKAEKLVSLAEWVWDTNLAAWEDAVAVLKGYVDEHGHYDVPSNYATSEGHRLGAWVAAQRSHYRNGRLTNERVRQLDDFDGWYWERRSERNWTSAFSRLLKYMASTGSSRVPSSFRTEEGFRLGTWASKQRSRFKQDRLDDKKVRALSDLADWSWSPDEDAWNRHYEALVDYVHEHGHASVPKEWNSDDDLRVGQWVGVQRQAFRKCSLERSKVTKLERVEGWSWHTKRDGWEKGHARLQEYCRLNGHCSAPTGYVEPDGFKLGQWIGVQRSLFKSGKLQPARVGFLDALPGWQWDARADNWERYFQLVVEYCKINGDAQVPQEYSVKGMRIGKWVASQRKRYHRGRLEKERVERLSDLPEWMWLAKGVPWERGYSHLRRYVDQFGCPNVPQSYATEGGYPLGSWVSTQRSRYRKGILDATRVQRLEVLTDWAWNPHEAVWLRGLQLLREYVNAHGDAMVPVSFAIDDFKLGSWVVRQRQGWKKGTLDRDKASRLSTLPGWRWSVR